MSPRSVNLGKTFSPCPKPDNNAFSLPFLIDEMDFSVWFKGLAHLNDIEKGAKILSILQTLNHNYPPSRQQIPHRTRLFFLEKLGSAQDSAAAMLALFHISGSALAEYKIDHNELGKTETAVWSCLELAKAYALLSEDPSFIHDNFFSLSEKTLVIHNGLFAQGKALLYISQTYSLPETDFWQSCYRFYQIAQTLRLTDAEVNPDATKIENAFKRILVFSLSQTNQFSPQEMRTIYELLGIYSTYASLLKSVPKKKFNGIPAINLADVSPPAILEEDQKPFTENFLYIATVNVASKILEATYDRRTHHQPVDRMMLLRLAKTLTLNAKRKDQREPTQSNHLGIMGFDAIVEFMDRKELEPEKPALIPGEIHDLDLELSEIRDHFIGNVDTATLSAQEFKVVEFTDPASIWHQGREHQLDINIHLLDRSNKGYGLLWTDYHIKPHVGNIVGILNKTLTTGLIRWLVKSKEIGMFMGIELLGTNAISVKVSNPGYPDDQVPAIFHPSEDNSKQSATMILVHHKEFQPHEFIFLHKNNNNIRYRITRQQHLTAFINHVEVIRSY